MGEAGGGMRYEGVHIRIRKNDADPSASGPDPDPQHCFY